MLKVQNISTGYCKKQVLFDVSFEVKQGEIVLLAGSNGSGKSTLLKAIYGQLPQWNNGQIFFNEENITGKTTATLLKKGLLYIPQKNNLFEDLTVKENLEMAGLIIPKNILKQRVEETLSVFPDLKNSLNRITMKLSGGERKILSLAMSNLHYPIMILIDEPLTGLSPKGTTNILENLLTLNQMNNITLLIVEHRVNECLKIANKVIGLKLGKVTSNTAIDNEFNVNQLKPIFV